MSEKLDQASDVIKDVENLFNCKIFLFPVCSFLFNQYKFLSTQSSGKKEESKVEETKSSVNNGKFWDLRFRAQFKINQES